MAEIPLEPGEVELGKWTLNLSPQGGGRYTGPLTVTNRRVMFLARFATSLGGALGELIIDRGDYGLLSIPKSRIKSVDIVGGFMKKKITLALDDGSRHVLDYGLLSVDKIAEAIRKS